MTIEGRTKSDFMSIRAWLRLAALGLIGLASLSCIVHYQMAAEVQSYAEQLRRSSSYQAINAELARDVTRAWLDIESGSQELVGPALTDLQKHQKVVQGVIEGSAFWRDEVSPSPEVYDRARWLQVNASLAELVKSAEAVVARSKASDHAILPASSPVDRSAFRKFVDTLQSNIITSRYSGAQSHSGVHFALEHLCTAALLMTGAMIAYGLFFFLFINHRIRARTGEVTNRLLMYASGALITSTVKPQGDEFGTIEAQIDQCARTVYGKQMEVEKAHEMTMHQLKNRTQELAKLNEALRSSGRALVRFLTDVSHDLRTPLAIMVGESEVSLRSKSTSISEYKETLSKMLEQTRYLGSLVDQLLYTARSKVSAVPLEPEYIDLSKIIRSACRDMQTLAANREITIKVDGTKESLITLGDQTRLREMILTILDNAIEYSKAHDAVTVSVVRQGPSLKLDVTDQGIGIPASEMPMIFRRFYRAQNASEANIQGTGIGLAVAKGIVESHNGTIQISSKENQGTTVTVLLPLVDKSSLENESHTSRPIAEHANM